MIGLPGGGLTLALVIAVLLTTKVSTVAATIKADERCRGGIFVGSDMLMRIKEEAQSNGLVDLSTRVQMQLTRRPRPYTGASAGAFLYEGRGDIFSAMELALYAAASGRSDAQAAGKTAAQILVSWASATMTGGKLKVMVPKESLVSRDDYAGLGLFVSLMAMGTTHAYQLLSCMNLFGDDEEVLLKNWFVAMATAIMEGHRRWESEDYFGRQIGNNHLSMHNAALYSIGVATEDTDLKIWAISDARNRTNYRRMLGLAIFNGHEAVTDQHDKQGSVPKRGEIYDRYRMIQKNRGLYYAFFHLLGLTLLAEAAANQGDDLYHLAAETGETLADAALYYGEFLARHRCDAAQPPVVSDGPEGFGYYAGARVEAHFWTWIAPLLSRLRGRADIAALAQRVAATACKVSPRPYLPIPLLFLGR